MRTIAALSFLFLVAGCDSAGDLSPIDAAAGMLVTSEADLLAARDAWDAAEPAEYRYSYTVYCEECSPGDVVTVRDGRGVGTRRAAGDDVQTLDALFETARGAFRPGYGGEIRISQTIPRFPVYVRVGRTEPEAFPTSDVGLIVTVTGFEIPR